MAQTANYLKVILDQLAEEAIPSQKIDLWSTLKVQLGEETKQIPQPGSSSHRRLQKQRFRLATAIILTVIILLAVFFATPQGRVLAQGFFHFINRISADTFPAPTDVPLNWVNQTPGVIPPTLTPWPGPAFVSDCGPYPSPTCSIAQIRSKVNFTVKEFGTLPDGMYFSGATGGPDKVYLLYDTGAHRGAIFLWQSPWTGSSDHQFQVGSSAVVETVKIGNLTGEYVKGSFGYFAGQPTVKWDPNADSQTLAWVDNGVYIEMQSVASAMPYERDQFVTLAESLTIEPVLVKLTPTPGLPTPTPEIMDMHAYYNLTLDEVKGKASFELLLPTRLPDLLSFLGARYDEDFHFVVLFYILNQTLWGPTTNGLDLDEERIPSDSECALCGFVKSDTMALDANKDGKMVPNFTQVKVGSGTGEYVAGDWENYKPEVGSWTWNPDPYLKRLRWQTKEMAFEISYFGMEITEDDMIAIVESIK